MLVIVLSDRAARNLNRILNEYVVFDPQYTNMDRSHKNTVEYLLRETAIRVREPDA